MNSTGHGRTDGGWLGNFLFAGPYAFFLSSCPPSHSSSLLVLGFEFELPEQLYLRKVGFANKYHFNLFCSSKKENKVLYEFTSHSHLGFIKLHSWHTYPCHLYHHPIIKLNLRVLNTSQRTGKHAHHTTGDLNFAPRSSFRALKTTQIQQSWACWLGYRGPVAQGGTRNRFTASAKSSTSWEIVLAYVASSHRPLNICLEHLRVVAKDNCSFMVQWILVVWLLHITNVNIR